MMRGWSQEPAQETGSTEMKAANRKSAFSLVELVIVIVIIGIIAAIAVPRISRGAKGATDSALKGDLTALRSAIDLYAAEHGGSFPTVAKSTGRRSAKLSMVCRLRRRSVVNW